MPKIFTACFCLMAVIVSAPARGQDQGPPDDQTAMMQAMQPVFQTIMQNMQEKGIDPRTFFQQMQNGTDPAEIQKQLIDQGLIDQKTLDQMNSSIQTIQSGSIKRQLNATDDEWKILWPLIQKVMKASAALNGSRGQMGGMGGFMAGASATKTDLSRAMQALRSALKDPATDAGQFASVLKEYRSARAQAQADLDIAQQNLLSVLNVRQEGILVKLGIIE